MHTLTQIAPILGTYDARPFLPQRAQEREVPRQCASNQQSLARASFGNLPKSRYAKHMSSSDLQWTHEERGDALVLSPKGRVDEATADAFKDHLIEAMQTGVDTAVIDLAGIDYMSSRGLRAFTLAQRAATQNGTTIVLAAPNDTLREILQISRYDTIFTVTETVEAALGT